MKHALNNQTWSHCNYNFPFVCHDRLHFLWSRFMSDLEKLRQSCVQLSERLASIDLKGAKFRAPVKPLEQHSTMVLRGLLGDLNLSPLCRDTSASLTADVYFSSLVLCTKKLFSVSCKISSRFFVSKMEKLQHNSSPCNLVRHKVHLSLGLHT